MEVASHLCFARNREEKYSDKRSTGCETADMTSYGNLVR